LFSDSLDNINENPPDKAVSPSMKVISIIHCNGFILAFSCLFLRLSQQRLF